MAAISGKAGSVKVDATVPAVVYSITSWEADLKGDAIDVTGMGDSGAKTFIGGLTEGSCSFECYEDSDHVLNADIAPGASVLIQLRYVSTDAAAWHGEAIVTSLKPTVSVEGAVKWSVAAQFTGAVEYANP
jgi:predicted secreted protein